MKRKGYYSSGQFAKMAHVSVRTIRFYDQKNLLKPSCLSESGARFYTDYDFAKLQQILLLKYLGFSLEDIREISTGQSGNYFLKNALSMQKKLVAERIEEMKRVERSIDATVKALDENEEPDWNRMLEIIHLTAMENTLKNQYQNASNILTRIRLHDKYSKNEMGWFPWIFEQCRIESGMKILEVGCGNGAMWIENMEQIQNGVSRNVVIVLSDISTGILRDARTGIEEKMKEYSETERNWRFQYQAFECEKIPYEEGKFDLVIANHLLFYCEDIEKVCREIFRVLKSGGRFLCSTYSREHMKEIRELVQEFDDRIVLSGEKLYENFGLENGAEILKRTFPEVTEARYEDEIVIRDVDPLVEYILSCHGNQNQYLLDRYADFRSFIIRKMKKGMHITKDVGIFIARKE